MNKPLKPQLGEWAPVSSFKEVYFSIFVLFFKISRWRGEWKLRTASMALSALLDLLFVSTWAAIQIMAHQRVILNMWVAIAILGAIAAANEYVLVTRGKGLEFERRFQTFTRKKRIGLCAVAVLIVISSLVALFFSIFEYRQTFPKPQPWLSENL